MAPSWLMVVYVFQTIRSSRRKSVTPVILRPWVVLKGKNKRGSECVWKRTTISRIWTVPYGIRTVPYVIQIVPYVIRTVPYVIRTDPYDRFEENGYVQVFQKSVRGSAC